MNTFISKKLFLPVILAAFLIAGLFGLSYFAMDMGIGGAALGCPFMNAATLCAMDPFEHITEWQNMFAASFSKDIFSLFVFALLIVFFTFIVWNFRRSSTLTHLSARIKHFITPARITRNALQEAFSSGILHPKIF